MKTESLLALGAGLAAGFVLGVMFAPEKGERTRKRILDAAEQALDAAEDLAKEVKSELEQKAGSIQGGLLQEETQE